MKRLVIGLVGWTLSLSVAAQLGGPSVQPLPNPQVPAPQAAVAPDGSDRAIESGKAAATLATADAALQKTPGDLDQLTNKIQALLALGRSMEALRMAVPLAGQHPERPKIRFLAGRAALDQGMVPQAVQVWSGLTTCADAEWAARAYRASAIALLAVGREAEARKLLDEALAKWPGYASLARLALETVPDAAAGAKIVERVIATAPENREDWEALRQILGSVSGGLFDEVPVGDKPLVIPVKEKSERVTVPAWGEGDKYSTGVTLSSGSRVTVPVTAGGHKQWMLVDSGSDLVLLTSNFAKDLGLKPVSTSEYLGLGYKGAMKSSWVVVPSLKVGDLEIKNVPAMIMDKDTDFWKELGGIVPLSLFRRHAVLYDRRHGKLTLYPSGTKAEEAMGDKLYPQRSLWLSGKPFVLAQIKDRQNLPCLLDTGSDTTCVAAEFAQELGIAVNSGKYKSQYARGLSGGFLSGTAIQVDLQLGSATFRLPTIMVTELGQGYPVSYYGLLGRDILDNFTLFFDYPKNVLVLRAYDR